MILQGYSCMITSEMYSLKGDLKAVSPLSFKEDRSKPLGIWLTVRPIGTEIPGRIP